MRTGRIGHFLPLLALAGVGISTTFVINSCRRENEPAPLVKEVDLPGRVGAPGGKPGANLPKLFTFDSKTLEIALADDDTVIKTFPQGFKDIEKTLAEYKDKVKKYNAVIAASNRRLTVGPVDLRENGKGKVFIPPVSPLRHFNLSVLLGYPIVMDPHNNMDPPVEGKITFNAGETSLVDSFEDNGIVERVKIHFTDNKGKKYDFMLPKSNIIVTERDEHGRPDTIWHIDIDKAEKPKKNNDNGPLF